MALSDIDTLLRNRLVDIQNQGVDQTLFVKNILGQRADYARQAQKIQADKLKAINDIQLGARNQELLSKTNPIYLLNGQGGQQPTDVGNAPKGFGAFLQAISGQESGNNYGARNASSGAMGKYQIMPGNIAGSGGWDVEALGRNVSTNAFMKSPQIQEAIAKYKLQQYYNKYGAAGAAVAWYAGEGNAKKYVASGGKGYNRRQGAYPSVSGYVRQVLQRMGYA